MFIHLLGMIAFFIGFGLLQRVGARARQAETVEHLRMWLGLMQTTRSMFPSAVVMLLVTGLYMTADAWTFGTSWVVVALVAVAVMSVMGIGVVPRFRRINAAAETAPDGPTSSELRKLVADPVAWASVSAPNGAAMGVVWLMATKPGWRPLSRSCSSRR
jgi:uncharacterized membrane protein